MTTPYRTPAEIVRRKPKFHLWCWLGWHKHTTVTELVRISERMGHMLQYPKLRAVWLSCSRCGERKRSPTLIEGLSNALLQQALYLYELQTFKTRRQEELDQLLEAAEAVRSEPEGRLHLPLPAKPRKSWSRP